MKSILVILLALTSIPRSYKTSLVDDINVIGVWSVTDESKLNEFEDTWVFKADYTFNELKYKKDGDTTLVPDENGTWNLDGKRLKIIVTGEEVNGEQIRYNQAQVMDFEIMEADSGYILTVVSNSGTIDERRSKLRLKKSTHR